jgi:hypothetical protein
MLRLLSLALLSAPLWAQAFRILPTPAELSPGEKAEVRVLLDCPAAKAPAALQFAITFPAQQLNAAAAPAAAPAAQDAGKSLTCSGRWKKAPETYEYACILAGGLKPLANGPVAVLNFRVPQNAAKRPARIRVEGEGASADAKKIPVAPAEASVTIR